MCRIVGHSAQEPSGVAPAIQNAPTGTKIGTSLNFPAAGLASIGVYDDQGVLIRSLSYAKPVTAGKQAFEWDGTTDLGLPAAPGTYHIRGVCFPEGPQIHYVMKVGLSGEPPYLTDDPNGLKNSGRELPYASFATGGYVDFNLGPDWKTPNRAENHEGDVRVIMARINGAAKEAFQMGYWPVKKELKQYRPSPKLNPQAIVSPVQQRQFDDISPIAGLTFAYQVADKGYTLEASVPFEALGVNPSKQPVVGFDVSAAFSDAQGQVRQDASHWAGESEALVVDRPGSAELKPSTWGTLQFDRNPLPASSAGEPSATPK